MFIGEYRLSLDEKGRMRIPNKLRTQIDDGYILMCAPGAGDRLLILSEAEFNRRFGTKNDEMLFEETEEQGAMRKLFSTACQPEEDAQGRFVLSAKLKMMTGIKKKVVFLGLGNRVEIWAEERYDEDNDPTKINMSQVAQTLVV